MTLILILILYVFIGSPLSYYLHSENTCMFLATSWATKRFFSINDVGFIERSDLAEDKPLFIIHAIATV